MIVLNFHGIAPQTFEPWICSTEQFESVLDLMEGRGYKFVSLNEGFKTRSGDLTCAITFDDARTGIESIALPILDARKIPFTVFVVTSFADGQVPPLTERYTNFLSWSAIKDLSLAGVEIGSHGKFHLPAYQVPEQIVIDDVFESKRILEDRIGRPATSYAAPHGQVTRAAQRAANTAGYHLFLSSFSGWNGLAARPEKVWRLSFESHTTFDQFRMEIERLESLRSILNLGHLAGESFLRTDFARIWRLASFDGVITRHSEMAAIVEEFAIEAIIVNDAALLAQSELKVRAQAGICAKYSERTCLAEMGATVTDC